MKKPKKLSNGFHLWYVDEIIGNDDGKGGKDDPLKTVQKFMELSTDGDYIHYVDGK